MSLAQLLYYVVTFNASSNGFYTCPVALIEVENKDQLSEKINRIMESFFPGAFEVGGGEYSDDSGAVVSCRAIASVSKEAYLQMSFVDGVIIEKDLK